MLKTYGIPGPTQEEFPDYDDRLAALVRYFYAETMLGHIPGGQRDAMLVDEAHDFETEWLSKSTASLPLFAIHFRVQKYLMMTDVSQMTPRLVSQTNRIARRIA
jgi:hypothetical protein